MYWKGETGGQTRGRGISFQIISEAWVWDRHALTWDGGTNVQEAGSITMGDPDIWLDRNRNINSVTQLLKAKAFLSHRSGLNPSSHHLLAGDHKHLLYLPVMMNCMCQLDWATRCPDVWSNIILGVWESVSG